MAEQVYKLTPDRDLQCYFLMPSAIAAISGASHTGFTVSGKWRQQFDWAVVEWNRDNTFEHPAMRNLPNGDLSGLVLTYHEERQNCIPFESNLVPIVDWDNLRIWAIDDSGVENLYHVELWPSHATPIEGSYTPASATMTLAASPGAGNRVGLALLESHFYYTVADGDSLALIAQGIAANINTFSADFVATSSDASVTLTWKDGPNWAALRGANGSRMTVYGFAENGAPCWQVPAMPFSGGAFPTKYQVTIDFGALKQSGIPTNRVRKLRWTWSADLQASEFQQQEFQVAISNWSVSGTNRQYMLAGPGSRRIEESDTSMSFSADWAIESGNYSGSRIRQVTTQGSTCGCTYSESATHDLYLGTRLLANGATVAITIDGLSCPALNTSLPGEDVLVRTKLGTFQAGSHTVLLTHAGPSGAALYFDFLEIVYPSGDLPDFVPQKLLALATDWDTYHSQSLPAERTAWLINKLGFNGRVNHYAGALWFYEITRPGTQYASAALALSLDAAIPNAVAVLAIAAGSTPTLITHTVLPDDTPENVAQALAALVNMGTNLVWASATGSQLLLTARAMGTQGDGISVALDPSSVGVLAAPSSGTLTGGVDGVPYTLDTTNSLNQMLVATADYWRTDTSALPRINRAARDWHQAYFTALKGYGLDCVTAFSTELMNGDPNPAAGLVQVYPDGTPAVLNTPSVQTNFSPVALGYWVQVYIEMAQLQLAAGLAPYLQFGEVQWWYFPNASGMPFYDSYTTTQFASQFGLPMQTIRSNTADPSLYPNECSFLPSLIGAYTAAIRNAVQFQIPACRFEVLYPVDTNDTPLNRIVNFPDSDWTPESLTCLKTENFTYTGNYNLDQSTYSIGVPAAKGFSSSASSHLVGIGDAWSPWMKEVDIARAAGLESVVLFALDQYCLIGYPAPPFIAQTRTSRQA